MTKQLLMKQNAIQGCFLFKQVTNMFYMVCILLRKSRRIRQTSTSSLHKDIFDVD